MVSMASGKRVESMSLADPELAAAVAALTREVARDRASSVKFLKSVGIMNRSGKTSKNFGG